MSNNRDIAELFFKVLFDVLGIPNKELRTIWRFFQIKRV